MIPGLENAEFVRYGVMHRNTFINSPKLLLPTMQMKNNPKLMFAGQITGVEGYIESASSGMVAGINMAKVVNDNEPIRFPSTTAHGALCTYITDDTVKSFQPMNVNFGIFPSLGRKIRNKIEKNGIYAERALSDLENYLGEI
jgi:methylenetetrahydrofolate--tRNA-(uracil-5-)-methyltransferase